MNAAKVIKLIKYILFNIVMHNALTNINILNLNFVMFSLCFSV